MSLSGGKMAWLKLVLLIALLVLASDARVRRSNKIRHNVTKDFRNYGVRGSKKGLDNDNSKGKKLLEKIQSLDTDLEKGLCNASYDAAATLVADDDDSVADGPMCTCMRKSKCRKHVTCISLGDDMETPEEWKKCHEVYVAIEGGSEITLEVSNINQSVVNEVSRVVFRDVESGEIINSKTLDNIDIKLTGSRNDKLTFIAPSLTHLRQTNYHNKREWIFEYTVELQLNDGAYVRCHEPKRCKLVYSYGYSPVIDYLSRTAAVAHQEIEFRIERHRSLQIGKNKLATKQIRIKTEGSDESQSCDYQRRNKITKDTPTSRYGTMQYSCDLNNIDYVHKGTFEYEDFAGKATVVKYAKTYEVDGSDFQIKILPTINSISEKKISRGGGKKLKIKGNSWVAGKTQFFIDGLECPVISEPQDRKHKKQMEAECEMPELDDLEDKPYYMGGYGWQMNAYVQGKSIDKVMKIAKSKKPNERVVMLNPESPYDNLDFKQKEMVTESQSFFKVPVTARYRFWLTGSEEVRLHMDPKRPNEILKQKDLPEFLKTQKATGFRNLYDLWCEETQKFHVSDWHVMMADDLYHMQLWHDAGKGFDHMTLGVEIENSDPKPNSRYEIQRISYRTPAWTPSFYFHLKWENFRANQRFDIQFGTYTMESGNSGRFTVKNIKVGDGVLELKSKFIGYMRKQFGIEGDLKVTREVDFEKGELKIEIGFPAGTVGPDLL